MFHTRNEEECKQSREGGDGGREGVRGSIDILADWHVVACVYVACGIAIKVEIQQSKQARKINDCNDC